MARIKYEVDGVKVPSLSNILDNCKIGGIGNLLYRANQAGLMGRQLKEAGEDTTNAGCLAFKLIDCILNQDIFRIDEYSDSCIDRASKCVDDSTVWRMDTGLENKIKSLSLVSESLKYGDTFDVFSTKEEPCVLVMLVLHNEVYPEELIKLASRANLLRENGIGEVTKSYILRINNPKTVDDSVCFHVHEYDRKELEYAFEVFKEMRKLYDMQDVLKTLV